MKLSQQRILGRTGLVPKYQMFSQWLQQYQCEIN